MAVKRLVDSLRRAVADLESAGADWAIVGLLRLLHAYNERAKFPLDRADVRFFELAMMVSVYSDMLAAARPHTHPRAVLRTIARLVKDADASR